MGKAAVNIGILGMASTPMLGASASKVVMKLNCNTAMRVAALCTTNEAISNKLRNVVPNRGFATRLDPNVEIVYEEV